MFEFLFRISKSSGNSKISIRRHQGESQLWSDIWQFSTEAVDCHWAISIRTKQTCFTKSLVINLESVNESDVFYIISQWISGSQVKWFSYVSSILTHINK